MNRFKINDVDFGVKECDVDLCVGPDRSMQFTIRITSSGDPRALLFVGFDYGNYEGESSLKLPRHREILGTPVESWMIVYEHEDIEALELRVSDSEIEISGKSVVDSEIVSFNIAWELRFFRIVLDNSLGELPGYNLAYSTPYSRYYVAELLRDGR